MLIKEYRIPLPLSVDEYKIAQLYMIAKKSKEESQGTGSGVEILKNEPYAEGPGGSGQYTYKIYHVGHHLPAWLKALLPKSALTVEEMAWNAYPYTKTRYTCPFIEKFSIEIETQYFNDCGDRPNAFNLSSSEIGRQIDVIDIVREQVFQAEIDPKTYRSEKTKRGPLHENWVTEYWNNGAPLQAIMCAYKLCRVEFKYWGMQSKIEKFIHDSALRKTMVTAHQQAWAWQDEWVDLTMADIRRLEFETQEYLRKRMADLENANLAASDGTISISDENVERHDSIASPPLSQSLSSNVPATIDFATIDNDNIDNALHLDISRSRSESNKNSLSQYSLAPSHFSLISSKECATEQETGSQTSPQQRKQSVLRWSRSNSRTTLHSPGECHDVISAWRMHSLVPESDSSSDEFYDAEDIDENSPGLHPPLVGGASGIDASETDNIFSVKFMQQLQSDFIVSQSKSVDESSLPDSPTSISPTYPHQQHQQQPHQQQHQLLIIILHGGSILDVVGNDVQNSKSMDITTFKNSLDAVGLQYYPNLIDRIVVRHVSCPAICLESLTALSSLSPFGASSSQNFAARPEGATFDTIPIGALPLFATTCHEYRENVLNVIAQCNKVYAEFLRSDDGKGFVGKVALIGDSVGAILGFDALCRGSSSSGGGGSGSGGDTSNHFFGSEASIQDAAQCETSSRCSAGHSNPVISITDSIASINCAEDRQTIEALSKSKTLPLKNSTNVRGDVSAIDSVPKQLKQQIYCKSLSHPGDCGHSDISNRLMISSSAAAAARRRSSGSSDVSTKLDFEVSDFFMFGSMLGIVLAYRKMLSLDDKSFNLMKPACANLYNLFHASDPSAIRIEPLLSARFFYLNPVYVPRFQKFPLGDGEPLSLLEYLQKYSSILANDHLTTSGGSAFSLSFNKSHTRRTSDISISSNNSPIDNLALSHSLLQRWWGSKRIDYALYCPEGLSNFPTHSLPHIFHSSYWESNDVISFILRQFHNNNPFLTNANVNETREACFKPNQPREKWQRKRTSMKLKCSGQNVTSNHRANDVIVREGMEQAITARFTYGPLDVVSLSGERVDIHMLCPRTNEWAYIATEVTDKNGRLTYHIPRERRLLCGLYRFKLVVRGDHTSLELFVSVIPPKTEAVVFSIDGSLAASVSVSGRDPKVRPSALDVVRFWQELGYIIIYITGRPDMQHQHVVSWLAQHNFPHGLTYFMDGLSTDPLRHKAEYLKNLNQKMEMVFRAAYGSNKDISVYQSLDLKPEQIYIVGKVSKKLQPYANILYEGYAAHLDELAEMKRCGKIRAAQNNARMVLPSRFGNSGIRSKHSQKAAKRTISYPIVIGNDSSSTATSSSSSNNNNKTTGHLSSNVNAPTE